ncbi:centrosomal protein of 68 kDa [Tympanuchus pallidicinctus]|uniref:centrosomal protein of 68 kDa n=1 Tax=Tympanuchus pallidicinctus TaxID=109042 RepID=UPI0022874DAF|nr:centrosomal protein of 68 kDa [Tympanuchus pallidicinctus]XP_052555136.1 centrosomal protein of 68 kDa [Tympanuchus pallidicinctus]XP_052555145.1 centrosomal protein of 68 kDa [Tympanuchus pallidicinctus]
MLMALDVAKSLSEASLSQKAKCYRRWDCMDRQTDYPELASNVHQLLGAEGAKATLNDTESLAMSGRGGLATGVAALTSRLPGTKANSLERRPLTYGADHSGDSSRLGHWSFLEQQQNSTEENGTASIHHITSRHWSQAPWSPSSSPLESLPQQTLPSPKSPRQSRSRSSFSTLSLEENSISEQQEGRRSQSSPASLDTPTAATWELCHQPGVTGGRTTGGRTTGGRTTGGRTLQARKALSPLLRDCAAMERVRKISSYQADYWACAIPDSLPPSPDRQSPHWNPNKEYEDLLDYTYPLKPKYKLGNVPEPLFHDSGVDLDSFSLSPEGTFRSTSIYGLRWQDQGRRENRHQGAVASTRRYSTPVAGKAGSAGAVSHYEPSPIAKASLARSASSAGTAGPAGGFAKGLMLSRLARLNSFDCPDVDGGSWCTRNPFSSHKGKVKSAERFLPTTQVLPLTREWDGDEEFLSLPPRLRELETLSQILSDLSLTIRTPRQSHWDLPPRSNGPETLSSEWAPFGELGSRDLRERTEGPAGLCHPYGWDSAQPSSRINREPLHRPHLPASSRAVLEGTRLSRLHAAGCPTEGDQWSESLAQCVKVFCHQLEELICWLYDVADAADGWVPPMPDAASVRAALHRYVEFRKDVADHRSLTESVLQRGAALLECMASNSPALKDTLGLIEKQSEELENHAERLYQSVLAAVGPVQGESSSSAQQAATQAPEAQWSSRVLPPSELSFVSQAQEG